MDVARLLEAIRNLESDEPEFFLSSIDPVSQAPADIAQLFVRRLTGPTEGRYLVFERLNRLGSLAIEPLRQLLGHDDKEVQVLAASALLWFDVRDGETIVATSARAGNPWLLLAIRSLRHIGSPDTAGLASAALLDPSVTDKDVIGGLLEELRHLGVPIDGAIAERLEAVDAPDWLRADWLRRR